MTDVPVSPSILAPKAADKPVDNALEGKAAAGALREIASRLEHTQARNPRQRWNLHRWALELRDQAAAIEQALESKEPPIL